MAWHNKLTSYSIYWRGYCQPSEASLVQLYLSAGLCTGSTCTSNRSCFVVGLLNSLLPTRGHSIAGTLIQLITAFREIVFVHKEVISNNVVLSKPVA